MGRHGSQPPKGHMTGKERMRPILFASAVLLTSLSPILKRLSQRDGNYLYNQSIVYLCAEVIKFFAMVLLCASPNKDSACSMAWQRRFLLTAFLYFLQNNLGFVVLLYYSASSFMLLMNLRIVVTALLSITLLNKMHSALEWCVIVSSKNPNPHSIVLS